MFQWDKINVLNMSTKTNIELNPLDYVNPSRKSIVRSSQIHACSSRVWRKPTRVWQGILCL